MSTDGSYINIHCKTHFDLCYISCMLCWTSGWLARAIAVNTDRRSRRRSWLTHYWAGSWTLDP